MKRILIIVILWVFSSATWANSCPRQMHLAGLVTDQNNNGLYDATVVVIYKSIKIASFKTNQFGWFETSREIIFDNENYELQLAVMKRNYKIYQTLTDVCKNGNYNRITMMRVDAFVGDTSESIGEVMFGGYVYDSVTQRPVQGSVLYVNKYKTENKKESELVASGVSRESGYFNIVYLNTGIDKDAEYELVVKNPDYDTWRIDNFQPAQRQELAKVDLTQHKYHFAISMGVQGQTTGTASDKESGFAPTLNLTWFAKELVVVNGYNPRPTGDNKYGMELSAGMINYLEETDGADTIEHKLFVGLGVIKLKKNSLLHWRLGVFGSDGDKYGAYLGVGLPLYYFGEHH